MLDERTGKWGIRVNGVELKSIDPPASIQEAMEKQMRAERDRRADDPHRRGRQAVADPHRRGREAGRDPRGRGREDVVGPARRGRRAAAILRAEGDARRSRRSSQAIHEGKPDQALLSYQYLQMLPQIAEGRSMKLMLIPSDAVAAMGAVAALGGGFQAGSDTALDPGRSGRVGARGSRRLDPDRDRPRGRGGF